MAWEAVLFTHRFKEDMMLVLSRKKSESIVIDDRIVLTIVDVRGDKVRIGIEAPKKVRILRQEVYDAIQREKQRAEANPVDE